MIVNWIFRTGIIIVSLSLFGYSIINDTLLNKKFIDKNDIKDVFENFLLQRQTNYGFVRGKKITTENNITGYGFFGIPYASPPTGNLRFRASGPPKKWFGVRNSTEFGKSCIWNSARTPRIPNKDGISEDCLFINIFSSETCLTKSNCSVLLYLHGGKYSYGDSNSLNSEMFIENFVSRDIVLGTINFRLGFLGFGLLNHKLTNLTMNSNVALFDVLEALKWIKSEIKYFGGNPNDVTVMGHSSGAMMSNFLYYSKRTDKMISKHIIMSGSSKDGHFIDGNEIYSRKIAIMAGCAFNTTNWELPSDVEGVLECLRGIDAQKIVDSQRIVEESGIEIFTPTYDKGLNSFLQFDFDYLVKNKPKRPLLIGNTLYEFVSGADCSKEDSKKVFREKILILCKHLCTLFDFKNPSLAINACQEEYQVDCSKSLDMTSDVEIFLANLRQCYENYNVDGDSYLYQFNYGDLKMALDNNYTHLPQHASDIVYITGQHKNIFTEVDYKIQERYSRMFVNFIKNSNPSDNEILFDKFDPAINNYYVVDFDKNGSFSGGMVNDYRKDAVKFWNEKLVTIAGSFKSSIYEGNFVKIQPREIIITSNTTLQELIYPDSYYKTSSVEMNSGKMDDLKNSPENVTSSTFYVISLISLLMILLYIITKNCRRSVSKSYQVFT
uniref:Carboxylic ester hydrolase n=1 Tax=Strongyloides venezuelensis TaxID=75913 RepID=A0A0K0EVZ8_STRVS